jgi:hypothetical protein
MSDMREDDIVGQDPGEGFDQLYPIGRPWSQQARQIAAIVWPAFLAAAFATMLFFAFIDPGLIGDSMTPAQEISRMDGYALGFFFFWLITMVSSSISILLIRSYNRRLNNRHQGSIESDE